MRMEKIKPDTAKKVAIKITLNQDILDSFLTDVENYLEKAGRGEMAEYATELIDEIKMPSERWTAQTISWFEELINEWVNAYMDGGKR